MDQDTARIANVIVTMALSTAVVRALNQSALRERPLGVNGVTMQYGTPMKALGVVALVMGSAMIVAGIVGTELILIQRAVMPPFGALMLYVFWEIFFVRHTADEQGVVCGSPGRKPTSLTWAEVRSFDYSPNLGWFVLRASDGRVARISPLIGGSRGLATLALEHIEPAAFTVRGRKAASDTAAGNTIVLDP